MGYSENNERYNPLTTDLYQLTMSQGFFNEGIAERESSYYLHWRTPALKNGTYSTVAGVQEALDYIKNFKFNDDDIAYLASIEKKGKKLFSPEFLEFLKKTPLKLDVDIMPEGEIQTTPGPVMMVKGPLYQCQLVESALLNIMNRNSMIASTASNLHEASDGAAIADNGIRRGASLDLSGTRASYIAGCVSTTDVDSARHLGIPVSGTMAHAYIMNFQEEGTPNVETELKAFKSFLTAMPTNAILLIDTYNSYQGIGNAIKAAIETNTPLDGLRIDSGNLADIALYAEKQLREAQKAHPELFETTKLVISDGMDAQKILELRKELDAASMKEEGKPFPKILVYGIGTAIQNPGALRGGVYKVSAHEVQVADKKPHGIIETVIDGATRWMEPVMKLAGINSQDATLPSSKASIPGVDLDIMRLWKDGKIVADIVVDKGLGTEKLLQGGKAINLHDNKTEVALPAYDKTETLLKPAFRRNAQGISEYVFAEPEKKTLYNGKQVDDLAKIRDFHLKQRAALPDAVRRAEKAEKPVVLIDPAIQNTRLSIIAKTNAELNAQPGDEIAGDLRANGGPATDKQVG
jgi:nicotinate phosphoribosyltransferase